ncbi:MAG: hypothetical protein AUJ72_05705 [Candidatus Omnitrophica bacterium CG1_02_46_14]|nr:MAG: hypothetical protein AUJ72_05705 [Candidatus Omnitrophica bacterium CG1_02_46_14]
MKISVLARTGVVVVAGMFVSGLALANIVQVKLYKEAFPDEKPKCACCHKYKMPKKDDGMHELNDYGKKVIAISKAPTADNYKAAGSAPEPKE